MPISAQRPKQTKRVLERWPDAQEWADDYERDEMECGCGECDWCEWAYHTALGEEDVDDVD